MMHGRSSNLLTKRELRMRAKLAWKNWPDTEGAREIIKRQEQGDVVYVTAWDRAIDAIMAAVINGFDGHLTDHITKPEHGLTSTIGG